MKKRIPLVKKLPVDQPAPFTDQIQAGLKAMARGTASETQQVAVFNWLIKDAAGIGVQSFRSDPHETAFAEGRRFVAIQIIHLTTQEATHGE